MVGLSFAAIPLYRVFCQATGYGGTPKIGQAAAPGGNGQYHPGAIQCRYSSRPARGPLSPINLKSPCRWARTTSPPTPRTTRRSLPVTGVALYNVTPEKAAKYFHKTACFCFNQQTLEGGQTMDFPLSFWVDPAINTDRDPNTATCRSMTLSYTFFRTLEDAAKYRSAGQGWSACRTADQGQLIPADPLRQVGNSYALHPLN